MRLIDADTLHAKIMKDNDNDLSKKENIAQILLRIESAPTIESEPVRHGRWIRNATSDGYHCSNCGHHADSPIGEMIDPRDYECYLDKYCGGCGAQMYADGGTISKERFAEIMTEILGGAGDAT